MFRLSLNIYLKVIFRLILSFVICVLKIHFICDSYNVMISLILGRHCYVHWYVGMLHLLFGLLFGMWAFYTYCLDCYLVCGHATLTVWIVIWYVGMLHLLFGL